MDRVPRLQNLSPAQWRALQQKLRRFPDGPESSAKTLERQQRPADLPLSYAQERLWFLEQLGMGPAYNISWGLKLKGELDEAALDRSFALLVARHESLRTRFDERGGVPHQVIEETGGYGLKRVDLHQWSADERERQVRRMLQEESEHRFDLKRGELLRTKLLKVSEREHVLLLTLHHIVADGWSMGIVLKELGELYDGELRGAENVLGELPVQYADYALWQRSWLQGQELHRHLKYWREQLSGAAVLSLPTDRARPAVASFRGAGVEFGLGEELSRELSELAKREGVTLFMLLLCAYQVLLSRYSGQKDIVVGTPVAGRTHPQTEELIGFFVNTLVLRTDLSGDPTFRELLGRVKEMTLDAYAHQDLPFEKLVAELQPERNLARQPLFQVDFVFQNAPAARFEWRGLQAVVLEAEQRWARFDLSLHVTPTPGGLAGFFEYASDVFATQTVAAMAKHFRVLLQEVANHPERRVLELSLMDERERRTVLTVGNATKEGYRRESCLHELLWEHALARPDDVAVECGGERLSYRDLEARAEQLAGRLRHEGVGPERVVGLCVERSVELVVGMVGILKAGGAYLPLDPGYPTRRLRYMAEDAGLDVVVTSAKTSGLLRELAFEEVRVDEWSGEAEVVEEGEV